MNANSIIRKDNKKRDSKPVILSNRLSNESQTMAANRIMVFGCQFSAGKSKTEQKALIFPNHESLFPSSSAGYPEVQCFQPASFYQNEYEPDDEDYLDDEDHDL